jgi:hypothetical protein
VSIGTHRRLGRKTHYLAAHPKHRCGHVPHRTPRTYRKHPSASVSIRQHTSAYGHTVATFPTGLHAQRHACINIHAPIHTCIYIRIYTCIERYHWGPCTYIYMHSYTRLRGGGRWATSLMQHTHTHTHTHTRKHTHTHTPHT